ncbi:sensor histidine kinase [Halobaculum litoreum]|uniref:histidine kinase n=2 Tax=Halobaculum litoreum TaxID=3031998 RepID=A0ABD5XQD6_9EURY
MAATDDETVERDLERLSEHVDRVYGLSEKAQTLANLWNDTGVVDTDLGAVAREEVSWFRETYPEATVTVSTDDDAWAKAHRDAAAAVHETLENVAVHNDPATVSVAVRVERVGDWVAVEVVDDGSSVPEEELAAIRATRELPLQHVTGLGLWVIYWIVELSDGELEMDNREPSGVSVRMRFPAAPDARSDPTPADAESA